jgi:aquaporin Z
MSIALAPAEEHGDTFADTAVRYESPLFTRMAAEAAGSFLIVLAILAASGFSTLGITGATGMQWLAPALAAGFGICAAYAAFGHVSGGHFNPAVTLGSAFALRTRWSDLLAYWFAHLIGAAAAALALWGVIPSGWFGPNAPIASLTKGGFIAASAGNGWGASMPMAQGTQGQLTFELAPALIIEVLIAVLFVGVFLGATSWRTRVQRAGAGAALAVTVIAIYVIAWPVTRVGLNPFRSFAAVLFSDSSMWGQLWVFLVAPLVGGAVAGILAYLFGSRPEDDDDLDDELDDAYDEHLVDDDNPASADSPAPTEDGDGAEQSLPAPSGALASPGPSTLPPLPELPTLPDRADGENGKDRTTPPTAS